jgi:hypothetical protein
VERDPSAKDEVLLVDEDRRIDIDDVAGMLSGKQGDRLKGVDGALEVGELDSDIISGCESGSKSGDQELVMNFEGSGRCSAVGDRGSKSGDGDLFGVPWRDGVRSSADVAGGSESGVLMHLFGVLQAEDWNRSSGDDDVEGEV